MDVDHRGQSYGEKVAIDVVKERRQRLRQFLAAAAVVVAVCFLFATVSHRPLRVVVLRTTSASGGGASSRNLERQRPHDGASSHNGSSSRIDQPDILLEADHASSTSGPSLSTWRAVVETQSTRGADGEVEVFTVPGVNSGAEVAPEDLAPIDHDAVDAEEKPNGEGTIEGRYGTIRRAQPESKPYDPFWNRTKELIRYPHPNCGCRKILLIVIFNLHDHYDNIPFIHTLYGNVFCNIVHYGPKSSDLYEVRLAMDGAAGAHQHKTVAQAFRDFPHYQGYMWAGDDVMINVHRMFGSLRHLDIGNIWLQQYKAGQKVDLSKLPQAWAWTHPFNKTTPGDVLVREWRTKLPERFKQRQKTVLGGEYMLGVASDMGYIPAEFMPDFAELTDLFPTLLFEIFIPTVARLLTTDKSRVQTLNGLYLWSYQRPSWFKMYNLHVHDFVHPVKLSMPWSREEVERRANFSWSPQPGIC
eukprot:scpid59551/ scgid18854/ 